MTQRGEEEEEEQGQRQLGEFWGIFTLLEFPNVGVAPSELLNSNFSLDLHAQN